MTKEPPSNAVVTPFPPRKPYEAFVLNSAEVPRFSWRSGGELDSLPYGGLLRLRADLKTGTFVRLSFWGGIRVTIHGRNLQALANAVRMQRCTVVDLFDAEECPAPCANEPIVERIEVEEKDQASAG